jgi:hypothetical protein
MRNSKFLFLLCVLALGGSMGWSQGAVLSGTWLGRLDQPDNASPFDLYRLRLELKQEGEKVTGMAYINVGTIPDYHAKMKLEGRFVKNVFTYHELSMVDERNQEGWSWCLKRAELTLKQVGEFRRLEGNWEGYTDDVACTPGTITLEKLNQQPVQAVVPKPVEAKGEFGIVEGRKITHRKEVEVYKDSLTVYVWDGDKVDGDIISLQYNGEWLLRKYTISKTKKPLVLKIEPGQENQLILFAENEGQYPPNTAALTFHDGKQERNLSLSSDKATCGALKLVLGK